MRVLACIAEDSMAELFRTIENDARVTRSQDSTFIRNALLGGTIDLVVVDPRALSLRSLRRIASTAARVSGMMILWTTLEADTIPAILAVNRMAHAEVILRDHEKSVGMTYLQTRYRNRRSFVSSVLNQLTPDLSMLPNHIAADILKVLLWPPLGKSMEYMLGQSHIERRTFERHLLEQRVCSINSLRHLGRILVTFEPIARGELTIERAAMLAGYPSGRELRINCHKYLMCAPSDFSKNFSAQDLASRVAAAIRRKP